MKRIFAALISMAFAGTALAVDCGSLADYKTNAVSFTNRTLDQSVWRVVRGTPFKVVGKGGAGKRVTVLRISGSLDSVIDKLVEQAGMAYSVDGCKIRLSEKTAEIPPSIVKSQTETKTVVPAPAPVTGVRVDNVPAESSLVINGQGYFELALGAGQGVAFDDVLKRIVPKNWSVKIEPQLAQRKVNWHGGSEWPRVLGEIARNQGLTVIVDVASMTVRVEPASSPKALERVEAWTLKANVPIHLQFAEWAQRAGWNYEWRLEKSWLVPAAANFTGTFDQVLAEAVEALHAEGKPVRLILWEGNRFAEIVDVDAK